MRKFRPFRGVKNDPYFFVARARFETEAQFKINNLLEKSKRMIQEEKIQPDAEEILAIKEEILALEPFIEKQQKQQEKQHVKRLASQIFHSLVEQGRAVVRSVGCRASYNALKAIAIMEYQLTKAGGDYTCRMRFDTGNIGDLQDVEHSQNVTAMVFELNRKGEINDNRTQPIATDRVQGNPAGSGNP